MDRDAQSLGCIPLAPPAVLREVTRIQHVILQNTVPVYSYTTPTPALVMSMKAEEVKGWSTPFFQRICLCGPKGVIVRATGQVDDDAMRNCISKARWDRYRHCLVPLLPSTMRIQVANNTIIPSMWK